VFVEYIPVRYIAERFVQFDRNFITVVLFWCSFIAFITVTIAIIICLFVYFLFWCVLAWED